MPEDDTRGQALRDLRQAIRDGEADRREMWREQGRMQERLAREETRGQGQDEALEKLTDKVDGLGKLAWGILVAVVLLLIGVITNLVIVSGGAHP